MHNSFMKEWFSNFAAQFNQMKTFKKCWWPGYVHKPIKSESLGMDPGHYYSFINFLGYSNVQPSLTTSVIFKCFLKFNVHTNNLGLLLRNIFHFHRSGMESKSLNR